VKKWLNEPNKTSFLHNAVDINLFKPVTNKEKIRLRKKFNLPINKPIVLFVGRLVEKKGFDKLFEARDKDYLILFVGDGDVPEQMKNKEGTLFLKGMPQEKLREMYQLADIFCLPSKNEGFPLTILEAMASGLPIITSDNPGYDLYLDRNYVKFIRSESKETEKAIKELLNDKKQLIQMWKYSRQESTKRFNWNKNVTSLLEVYAK
jgi:glycosyltransferase involved in cell wall biosynthesis